VVVDRTCVVLLSGGLDSTTVLAIAQSKGFQIVALSLDYGQRHRYEIDAAKMVADYYGVVRHVIVSISSGVFGGSALIEGVIPKNRKIDDSIPSTYVPARNTVLLSLALALAESVGSSEIFIGVNAVDYSGYPDCREEYIESFERMANLATKIGVEGGGVSINVPLIHLSKSQIIRLGIGMGVDYGLTHSCYDPGLNGKSCGSCDACVLRSDGFAEVGIEDPRDNLL